jgi:hypothetical protein
MAALLAIKPFFWDSLQINIVCHVPAGFFLKSLLKTPLLMLCA